MAASFFQIDRQEKRIIERLEPIEAMETRPKRRQPFVASTTARAADLSG
jgi:hypothetical protein